MLPVLIWNLHCRQSEALEATRRADDWRQDVLGRIENFRGNYTFAAQIDRFIHDFRELAADKCSSTPEHTRNASATSSILRGLFRSVIPKTHRPQETSLLAIEVSDSGPGTLNVVVGNPPNGIRILSAILQSLGRKNIPPHERSALNRRVAGFFGRTLNFDFLRDRRKGKLTRCSSEGKHSFFIWDSFPLPGNSKLVFIAFFPVRATSSSLGLQTALREVESGNSRRIYTFLVPIGRRSTRKILPGIRPAPSSIKTFIRRWRREWKNRDDFAPVGKPVEPEPGVLLVRDGVSGEFPYEIWVVGKTPRRAVTDDPAKGLTIAVILSMGIFFWRGREMLFEEGNSLSLRAWFGSFFLLAGAIPLIVLYQMGIFLIEAGADRGVSEAIRKTLERLQSIDSETIKISQRFSRAGRDLVASSPWLDMLRNLDPNPSDQVMKPTFDTFRNLGLPLEYLQVIRFGSDSFVLQPEGNKGQTSHEGLDMFLGFCVNAAIEAEPARRGLIEKALSTNQKNMMKAVLAAFPKSFWGDYFNIRRRAILMGGALADSFLQFIDFTSRNDHLDMALIMVCQTREALLSHILEGLCDFFGGAGQEGVPQHSPAGAAGEGVPQHSPAGAAGEGFALAAVVPGGLDYIKTGGASRIVAPRVRKLMEEAAFGNSVRTRMLYRRRGAIIAFPFKRVSGFICGIQLPLDSIHDRAEVQRSLLTILLGTFGLVMVLLSIGIGKHLLDPLLRIEEALRSFAAGNLGVRVGIDRGDELGEITRRFDRMIEGLIERLHLGRFVSATLDKSLREKDMGKAAESDNLALRHGTVLVSDLREFTTMTERYPAPDIVTMLNRHLETMTEEIRKQGGQIEQFIGDAVVAVFLAEDPRVSMNQAVAAGLGMVTRHAATQEERAKAGIFQYRMGVGIADGPLVVGSFGSSERREFAVLGSPRNTAEKLEALSKKGHLTHVVVTENIRRELGGEWTFEALPGGEAFELGKKAGQDHWGKEVSPS